MVKKISDDISTLRTDQPVIDNTFNQRRLTSISQKFIYREMSQK